MMNDENAPAPDAFLQDTVTFGKLVLMAYKMSDGTLNPPTPSDFPPDYEIVKNVIMDDYGTPTFYGFIAHSKQPKANSYVLVIRGTLGFREWLADLQSVVPVPFYTYGNVGSGFADTYKTIYLSSPHAGAAGLAAQELSPRPARRPFAAQVAEALQMHAAATAFAAPNRPAPRFAIVGHSLGSALVTLYAVERLVYPSLPIDKFYTFASPLVGDAAFGAAFDALNLPVANRIFDDWDPVPSLPPLSGFAPVGIAKEIKLNSSYYRWDPFCSHSMDTYLNYFDPSHQAAAACTTIIPTSAAAMAAPGSMVPASTRRAVVVSSQADRSTTSITQGPNTITITITIQTSG